MPARRRSFNTARNFPSAPAGNIAGRKGSPPPSFSAVLMRWERTALTFVSRVCRANGSLIALIYLLLLAGAGRECSLSKRWPSRLWIVRHGESAGNVARDAAHAAGLADIDISARDVDVPLSPLGQRQSQALGRWFAALPPLPDGDWPATAADLVAAGAK